MNKIVIMIIKISFIITIFWHNEELYTFHLMTVEMLKIAHKKKNKRKLAKRLLITLLLKTHGKTEQKALSRLFRVLKQILKSTRSAISIVRGWKKKNKQKKMVICLPEAGRTRSFYSPARPYS